MNTIQRASFFSILAITAIWVGYFLFRSDSLQIPGVFEKEPLQGASGINDGHIAAAQNSLLHSPQNKTLGFQKFFYMNEKTRLDFEDTITLQSSASGIIPEWFKSVELKELQKSTKGLPPASVKVTDLRAAAVYRTHANIWQQMIKEKWETALIIEPEALWDVNIREIMAHFSKGLEKMIKNQHEAKNLYQDKSKKTKATFKATETDPYLHKHWEILQFGGCYENKNNMKDSLRYLDPHSPNGATFVDGSEIENNTRVVRWGNDVMCSTAYAITRMGAIKLLLRAALDINMSIDSLIAELVKEQRLESYSVFPVFFSQWEYIDNVGAEVKEPNPEEAAKLAQPDPKIKAQAWAQARKDMSVWRVKKLFSMSAPKKGALTKIKDILYN